MNSYFTEVNRIANEFGYKSKLNSENSWPLEIYNGRSHLLSVNNVGGIVIENGYYKDHKAKEMLFRLYDLNHSMNADNKKTEDDVEGFNMTEDLNAAAHINEDGDIKMGGL